MTVELTFEKSLPAKNGCCSVATYAVRAIWNLIALCGANTGGHDTSLERQIGVALHTAAYHRGLEQNTTECAMAALRAITSHEL